MGMGAFKILGARMIAVSQRHSEEKLRNVVRTLCDVIWHGRLKPGDHLWSIPADPDRDFDLILSDAITELVELRAKENHAD